MASSKKKLRILMVVEKFPEISNPFILNQITGLIDLGHDVSIFSMYVGNDKIEHLEVQKYELRKKHYFLDDYGSSYLRKIIYVLKSGFSLLLRRPGLFFSSINIYLYGREARSLKLLHHVASAMKIPHRDFDIIHAQFGPLGKIMLNMIDVGVVRGKLVTHFRGYDATLLIRSRGKDYYNDLFSSGDMFLAVCEYMKNIIINLGSPKEKTFVQYSGIEVNNFSCKKDVAIKHETLRIGSVGRLWGKKGYKYIIIALAKLKEEGFDFTYKIVGDGKLRCEIESLISQFGLQENVVLLGNRNNVYISDFLKEIDVFISHNVTSERGNEEGIPNTLKEAMLSGIPVFTTYHAGIPELISNEVNGFLTEEKNIEQLVRVLKKYAFSSISLQSISINARDTVIDRFDNKILINNLISRYYSLLHQDI